MSWIAAFGAASAGVLAVKPVLALIGFTKAGVAAHTTAAVWQASIGNVVLGSAFATMQSLGAGAMLSWTGPVGLAGLGLSSLVFWLRG
ncbi:unnamed protein product [Peniophora sp. CBMAI 1063]|nr:unnamed protein product [Peniophora sp. CBMAI 1063]